MSKNSPPPQFSIIVPTFNAEPFLPRLVESVQRQSFSDWELILVNDSSTDGSLALMNEYKRADERISVLNLEKNAGQANARNQGIPQARGEWILFADADDAYFPEALEKLYKVSGIQAGLDILYFNAYVLPHNRRGEPDESRALTLSRWTVKSFASAEKSYAQALLDINMTFFSPWVLTIRRTYLAGTGLLFENYSVEDWLFNWLLLARRPNFYFLNEPLYKHFYLGNGESTTSQIARYTADSRLFDYFAVFERGKNALSKIPEWNEIREHTYRRGLESILGQLVPFQRAGGRSKDGEKAYERYLRELHALLADLPAETTEKLLNEFLGNDQILITFLSQPLNEDLLKKLIARETSPLRRLGRALKLGIIERLRDAGAVADTKALAGALRSRSPAKALTLSWIVLKKFIAGR